MLTVNHNGEHFFAYISMIRFFLVCDRVFERDGSSVVIDVKSFELIKGATVDYKEELIRSAFSIVNNPQSESACGCGSSFAAKNFGANPARD